MGCHVSVLAVAPLQSRGPYVFRPVVCFVCCQNVGTGCDSSLLGTAVSCGRPMAQARQLGSGQLS